MGLEQRLKRAEKLASAQAAAQPAPVAESAPVIEVDPEWEANWAAFREWFSPDWRPDMVRRADGHLVEAYDPASWPAPPDGQLADGLVRQLVLWATGFAGGGAYEHPSHRRWTPEGRLLTETNPSNRVDHPLWWYVRDRPEHYPAAALLAEEDLQRLRVLYRRHLECPPALRDQVWEIVLDPSMSGEDLLLAISDLKGGEEVLWPWYVNHGPHWPHLETDEQWGDRIIRHPGPDYKIWGYTRAETATFGGGRW